MYSPRGRRFLGKFLSECEGVKDFLVCVCISVLVDWSSDTGLSYIYNYFIYSFIYLFNGQEALKNLFLRAISYYDFKTFQTSLILDYFLQSFSLQSFGFSQNYIPTKSS